MFNFLKDMFTVAKTDIDLALLSKGDATDNRYQGVANEGYIISKIDDEISSIDAMNALIDKIDGKEIPENIGEMITKATMVIEFLRESGYTDDQIQKIGSICNLLERNGGDTKKISEMNISETDIIMAIDAYNKYMASIGCPPKWVVQIADNMMSAVTEEKKEEKKTTSSSKSTKKASNTKKETEMIKPFTVPVSAGAN